MNFRAKMKLESVTRYASFPDAAQCKFNAISIKDGDIPENEHFAKYTPSGSIELAINNPLITDNLVLGQIYYVDFLETPK